MDERVFAANNDFGDFFVVVIVKAYQAIRAVRRKAARVGKPKRRGFLADNAALVFQFRKFRFAFGTNKFAFRAAGQAENGEEGIQNKAFDIVSEGF